MSRRDDILWSLNRQSRTMEEVFADARLVWRDTNAKTAEQRFVQPRTESDAAIIAAISGQHRDLESAFAKMQAAEEQHGISASGSAQARDSCEGATRSGHSAMREASTATGLSNQADQRASEARSLISEANSAGA